MRTKAIIGIVAVFILAAAGGGGWYYLKISKSKPQNPNVPTAGEQQVVTPIVDVDDILNHSLKDAEALLGASQTDELQYCIDSLCTPAVWKKGNIQIAAFMTGRNYLIQSVTFLFNGPKETWPTKDKIPSLIGLDAELSEQKMQRFTSPEYHQEFTEVWPFVNNYGAVMIASVEEIIKVSPPIEPYYGVVILTQEAGQKMALMPIKAALEIYHEKNNFYPSTQNQLLLWDQQSIESTVLAGLAWRDFSSFNSWIAAPSGKRYGYRSNGETYELTAVFDDKANPGCIIEDNFCIYRIRNGEVVSNK